MFKKQLKMLTMMVCCLSVIVIHTNAYADLYLRGRILYFLKNPLQSLSSTSYQYDKDGLLIIHDGKIKQVGSWAKLKLRLPHGAKVINYVNGLIMPGFVDTHIHYPQLDMIAADNGGHLLQWLNHYTFPFEVKFSNNQYATNVANFFLDQLLKNGTTTANIFTTIYPNAVNALFEAADKRKMQIIAGEVIADQNIPQYLIQDPQTAIKQSQYLIKKWNNKMNGRLHYAIQIRFAPSTSRSLFRQIQSLRQSYHDVRFHTHVAENHQVVDWTKKLFNVKYYTRIYSHYNLLSPNTILAHGVWLTKQGIKDIARSHTGIAFCPTSNLFLGSGLFNLRQADNSHLRVGLGTDVGAGTSFSLLRTLNEAYKVLQLQHQNLTALHGFYLITLGGARALNLQDRIGNFLPGKDADVVVLNIKGATPLLKRRMKYADTLEKKLFVLMMLGDDRSILATYTAGHLAYHK